MSETPAVLLQTAASKAAAFCMQRHKHVDGTAVMLMASYIQAALPRSTSPERVAVLGAAFDTFTVAVGRSGA